MKGARLHFARDPGDVIRVGGMASRPFLLFARMQKPGAKRVISAQGTDVSFPLRGGTAVRVYGAYLSLGPRLLRHITVLGTSSATARQRLSCRRSAASRLARSCFQGGWCDAKGVGGSLSMLCPMRPRAFSFAWWGRSGVRRNAQRQTTRAWPIWGGLIKTSCGGGTVMRWVWSCHLQRFRHRSARAHQSLRFTDPGRAI